MTFVIPDNIITITEGEDFSLAFSHTTPLAADTTIRWEIVPTGFLSARASDFSSLTGTLPLTSGQNTFTLTIPSVDDSVYSPSNRGFRVDLYQERDGQDDLAIGSVEGLINDNDASARPTRRLNLNADDNKNVLSLGTIWDTTANGLVGNDNIIITPYTYSNIRIADGVGVNTIILDGGVEITKVVESVQNFEARFATQTLQRLIDIGRIPEGSTTKTAFREVTLTLDTGAEITWASPANRPYQYRVGDGEILNYIEFRDAIGLGVPSFTSPTIAQTLDTDVIDPDYGTTIDTYADASSIDIAGNTPSTRRLNFFATDGTDVLYLGSDFEHTANGLVGDDYIVISRFVQADATIVDGVGVNTIKLDVGVGITRVVESAQNFETRFASQTLERLIQIGRIPEGSTTKTAFREITLTLDTGAEISWTSPANRPYQYQIGEGEILNYIEFRTAIGLGVPSFTTPTIAQTLDTDETNPNYSYTSPFPATGSIVFTETRFGVDGGTIGATSLAKIEVQDGGGNVADYTPSLSDLTRFQIVASGSERILTLKAGTYDVGDVFTVTITLTLDSSVLTETFTVSITPNTGSTYLRWVDDAESLTDTNGDPVTIEGEGLARFQRSGGTEQYLLSGVITPDGRSSLLDDNDILFLDDTFSPDSAINLSLGGGDDMYVIQQGFNSNHVTINDPIGLNVIRFGQNVAVTEVSTTSIAGRDEIAQAVLTIDQDTSNADTSDTVTLTIVAPQGDLRFIDQNDESPVLENFDTFFAELI